MRHNKKDVIARTRREFAILDRLVRRLRAADWQRRVPRPPTRDPWTVKDALAHIVYWKEHSARVFRGERRLPEMRGLDVNAICPSAAETERLDHMGLRPDGSFDQRQREERIGQTAASTPLGRIARPSDVAEVAAFLAGDAAEYITGQSINVTGGGVMH